MVGGGPSGLSAAISAARAGADVVLCERYGCFGGVITTVGMETIAWYRYEGCVDTEVRYAFCYQIEVAHVNFHFQYCTDL